MQVQSLIKANTFIPSTFLFLFQTEQFAVLWALFTVIVLGNSAVLVTLLLNKNRKSRMNFFIKQLAIAGTHLRAFSTFFIHAETM